MVRTRDVPKQQERLSAATWSVLAERGLPGLTVRAVAEQAGCTTGLVFHTFPTKRALLIHARELLFERAAARVDAVEQQATDPAERLRAVARALLALGRDGGDEARVWVSYVAASLADPELAHYHLAGNRALHARMTRLIEAAHPDWEKRRVTDFAAELIAMIEGFNTLSILDPATYSSATQERALARVLDELD